MSTKGSWSRVRDKKAWDKNWERAFKDKPKPENSSKVKNKNE